MSNNKKKNSNYLVSIKLFSLIFLFILWEILSAISDQTTLPSLISIIKTLFLEILEGELLFI